MEGQVCKVPAHACRGKAVMCVVAGSAAWTGVEGAAHSRAYRPQGRDRVSGSSFRVISEQHAGRAQDHAPVHGTPDLMARHHPPGFRRGRAP